jgi:hypothetical protein
LPDEVDRLEVVGVGQANLPAALGVLKLNALVRSPTTARRHGVMLASTMSVSPCAKRASRKRINEVWSSSCELTQPPLVHGETMSIGTRIPRPYGPAG